MPHYLIKLATLLIIVVCIILFIVTSPPIKSPIKNITPSGTNIICFGDSLTYGTGASSDMDYPAQLSRLIEEPIINAGVPGDTTAGGLLRLEKDVLSQSPRIVFIALGANDLRIGISKEVVFGNLRKMIDQLQRRGTLVVIGGVDVPLWGKGFVKEYQKLAKETGSLIVPNVLEGILGNKALMSDLIHPNDKGYRRIAEAFHEVIRPYL